MKVLYLAALIGVCLAKVDYTGHKVYRAYPDDAQIGLIGQIINDLQLDVWSEARFSGDSFDFRVPPELRSKIDTFLARKRIRHEVMIEDVQHSINTERDNVGQRFGEIDYGYYRTIDEITQWISQFTEENSDYVTTKVIGASYEKRNIQALKISDGGALNSEFVINCGLHAREWVSPAACMKIADMLVKDYKAGQPDVVGVDFHIILSSNPDGYDYTWTVDRMWRKTTSVNDGCRCDGVDPNRNFDINWSGPGASSMCCNDAYYGPSAFSESETRVQRDFVAGLRKPKAYIDIHAYSQYWMFPYGYKEELAADYNDLNKIGTDSVNAIKAVHGKTYVTGPISTVIYVASGSSADYFYEVAKIKCSWAAELRDRGLYGFNLPESQIIPTAEETYAGLKVISQNILNGTC